MSLKNGRTVYIKILNLDQIFAVVKLRLNPINSDVIHYKSHARYIYHIVRYVYRVIPTIDTYAIDHYIYRAVPTLIAFVLTLPMSCV